MAWSLAEKVLSRVGSKLQPLILKGLKSTATSIDMYSPVVKTICDSVQEAIIVHEVVNTEETEAAEPEPEPELGREVALKDDALEENLDRGNASKETLSKSRSKRPVRDGTVRINVNGNNSRLLKEDAETELGVSGKRGRKPNSLMNPEDYDISWVSGKRASVRTSSNTKLPKKGSGGGESSRGESSRGKKRPLPKETSPAITTRSVKRSRVKIEDSDHDLDSPSSPKVKKLASCFRDEVPREKESDQEESDEIPEEDERKIGTSSKKTRSQNGLKRSQRSQRSAQKKPIVEAKIVSSEKISSDGKIIRTKTANWAYIAQRKNAIKVPQSSEIKKLVSQVAEETGETSKSHSTKRQKTRTEVESEKKTFGKDLVGRRVNIWWPLDKKYYEGVVKSYSTRKKTHLVLYLDGDSEELNLVEQRWKLLEDEDHTSANEEDMEIDLPESVPLIDILRRQKLQKCKNLEPASPSGVRSSGRTVTKKGSGKKGKKQAKRGKGGSKTAAVKNLKSLKESSAKIKTTEEQEEDDDNENDDSEKQEQSEGKSEEESRKLTDTEAETKEEEKQSPNSEAASERNGSGSEEEPKWRETDVMEDGAEEKKEEMVDGKEKNSSSSEMEKEEDEDRDFEAEAEERVEVNGTNMSETEKEADKERDMEEVNDKGTNISLSESVKEGNEDKEMDDVADEKEDVTDKVTEMGTEKDGEEREMEDAAEEREEVDGKTTKPKLSEVEKEGENKDMESEAEEREEMVDDKVTKSEIEKEEDGKKAVENEAEEREEVVEEKVTKTNLSETEKEMEDEAEEREKMMVDDKVTSTNLSEIEKEEAEEKKET